MLLMTYLSVIKDKINSANVVETGYSLTFSDYLSALLIMHYAKFISLV